MAKTPPKPSGRRDFLKSVVAGAATLATTAEALPAAAQPHAEVPSNAMPILPPMADADPPAEPEVLNIDRSGSDYMVDVLKSLGIEYVCSVAGSSFRALHESVINYGGNKSPEFISCCHEESSVAIAHGYAKIEGKPIAIFAHGTVGLQHASMAIYNAYCDRVPVYIVIGNNLDATKRDAAYGEWPHSVQDAAAMVRDYTKWDDLPISLQHFGESAVRAYKVAMTPPMGPVLIVADSELQEHPIEDGMTPHIPKLTLASPPQGDSGSVAEAARMLVQAENPLIVVDRYARTQAGIDLLVQLAETLQVPVIDQAARMNFPTRHPLNQSSRRGAVVANADVIMGLEATDFWSAMNTMHDQVNRTTRSIAKSDVKLISITTGDLYTKANYQDFFRYTPVDLAMAADPEATLPSLIEEVKRQIPSGRKQILADRGKKLAAAHDQALDLARTDASYAWDASPVSTGRLCAEIWAQIKDEDWSLVSLLRHFSWWPLRLWPFDKHYQYIGIQGGGGVGYNAPASVGAALANKKYGRLSISIQDDGDLLFGPTVLWTAAHHHIPLLSVMHNNRAYHEELMHVQRMANRHNRGIDRAHIGTTFEDPAVDFAKLAQGLGVYAEGPITDPNEIAPALKRAIAVVKRGEPALVDVVTQPR
ncbi:MAG TPA: thiamine pyrophosphate-dependent enzyme [Candidatus Saccharimonadales bacterium]|jgi:acetolactate synthase-1/2/3 large subunit|nr:thiamine pyrophosphate-dependent enzyme [Candidatus Saccharimonadales bacterium]